MIELVRLATRDGRRYAEYTASSGSHLEVEPRVALDDHGNIILWYLPGLLTFSRQVSIIWFTLSQYIVEYLCQ